MRVFLVWWRNHKEQNWTRAEHEEKSGEIKVKDQSEGQGMKKIVKLILF